MDLYCEPVKGVKGVFTTVLFEHFPSTDNLHLASIRMENILFVKRHDISFGNV